MTCCDCTSCGPSCVCTAGCGGCNASAAKENIEGGCKCGSSCSCDPCNC